jgi:hypothetical protein
MPALLLLLSQLLSQHGLAWPPSWMSGAMRHTAASTSGTSGTAGTLLTLEVWADVGGLGSILVGTPDLLMVPGLVFCATTCGLMLLLQDGVCGNACASSDQRVRCWMSHMHVGAELCPSCAL